MQISLTYLSKPRFMLALLFSVVLQITLEAQQIAGIYLSGTDFSKGHLSYARSKGKKCKVKLHHQRYKPFISVKYSDSLYTLKKDSIFGYRDNSGIDHRFFDRSSYPVLNQGEEILIYRVETTSANPKDPQTIIRYYFSKNCDSKVIPLTELNLEDCFKDNKTFIEFLEIHFKNDSELPEYDHLNKMYKINRLLQLSRNQKK